jgi:hypothetical protein
LIAARNTYYGQAYWSSSSTTQAKRTEYTYDPYRKRKRRKERKRKKKRRRRKRRKRGKRRKEGEGKLLTVGPSAKALSLVNGIRHKDT